MPLYRRLVHYSRSALGTIAACGLAAFVCLAFRNAEVKPIILILFLAVVSIVAVFFGVFAGTVGTCICAMIFALFFLPPLGSLSVADGNQRAAIAWFLIGGLSISLLFGTTGE